MGEKVEVFNDKQAFTAEVIGEKKEAVRLMLIDRIERASAEFPVLCVSLVKIPRLEEAIQKATEIGVSKIIVFVSEFSQGNLVEQYHYKKPRFQKLIHEACKQSGSLVVPELVGIVEFEKLSELIEGETLILHPTTDALTTKEIPAASNLIVGPEAGFSDTELAWAKKQGYKPWKLSTNILRTETAAALGIGIVRELSA